MTLFRRALGESLRSLRLEQGRTLGDVAQSAGVSLAHLSALERGRSEASSEILAALCRALGVPLASLLAEISRQLRRSQGRPSLVAPTGPVLLRPQSPSADGVAA